MSLTSVERMMARHALGLPNNKRCSYRNHYAVNPRTKKTAAAWDSMAARGLAEKGRAGVILTGYCLTAAGAKAALDPGEKLDTEDFPDAQDAS